MARIQDVDLPYLEFGEAAAPGTPASGIVRIYAKSDGSLYQKDDAGTETGLAGGGAAFTPAFAIYNRNSTSYTTTSTSFVDVDATNLALAVTTGAHRVRVTLCGTAVLSAAGLIFFDLLVDGTSVSSAEGIALVEPATNQNHNVSFTYITNALTAASHTIKLQWKVSTGTGTLFAGDGGANVLQMAVEELPV